MTTREQQIADAVKEAAAKIPEALAQGICSRKQTTPAEMHIAHVLQEQAKEIRSLDRDAIIASVQQTVETAEPEAAIQSTKGEGK